MGIKKENTCIIVIGKLVHEIKSNCRVVLITVIINGIIFANCSINDIFDANDQP